MLKNKQLRVGNTVDIPHYADFGTITDIVTPSFAKSCSNYTNYKIIYLGDSLEYFLIRSATEDCMYVLPTSALIPI